MITGSMLIGSNEVTGQSAMVYGINPANGEKLEPGYAGGTQENVDLACALAVDAFDTFRNLPLEKRASFMESVADEIMALGDELVERVMAETGLPQMRVVGERGRTVGQLRLFAQVVRDGLWQGARIDTAMPDREPLPRLDHRMRYVPLGPVAVFGASNFPLAFSVAGGDTTSAFAAGCPVIVKAHSSHPGTSELVGRAVQKAVKDCELPEGVFSMLFGSGREVGSALVKHPAVKAVGFTGSQGGGTALMNLAAARPEPIPVYAEMSSINPVYLLPTALDTKPEAIAEGLVASMLMGAGQFCTSPGLVFGVKGEGLDRFVAKLAEAMPGQGAQTMLSPVIHGSYVEGVAAMESKDAVSTIARSQDGDGPHTCCAALFRISADGFINDHSLREEVFGSCSLVVECDSFEQMIEATRGLEGQLTASVHATENEDVTQVMTLMSLLELKAGRLIWNGFGTGVEVCQSMVHGGPYPATSDSRTTSVGTAAIDRFLRPVCYQNMPDQFLPDAVKVENPQQIVRMNDGKVTV